MKIYSNTGCENKNKHIILTSKDIYFLEYAVLTINVKWTFLWEDVKIMSAFFLKYVILKKFGFKKEYLCYECCQSTCLWLCSHTHMIRPPCKPNTCITLCLVFHILGPLITCSHVQENKQRRAFKRSLLCVLNACVWNVSALSIKAGASVHIRLCNDGWYRH